MIGIQELNNFCEDNNIPEEFRDKVIDKMLESLELEIEELKNKNNNFIETGWKCPICGRVYSPSTQMCFYCGNNW